MTTWLKAALLAVLVGTAVLGSWMYRSSRTEEKWFVCRFPDDYFQKFAEQEEHAQAKLAKVKASFTARHDVELECPMPLLAEPTVVLVRFTITTTGATYLEGGDAIPNPDGLYNELENCILGLVRRQTWPVDLEGWGGLRFDFAP